MIRGRAFDAQDRAGSPPVAILNQTAAHMLFPGEDPVGKRVRVWWSKSPVVEVVGVVADIRHSGVSTPPDPCLFMPNDQKPFPFTALVVRTAGAVTGLPDAIRQQIRMVDGDQGIAKIEEMSQMVSDSIARPRLEATVRSDRAGTGLHRPLRDHRIFGSPADTRNWNSHGAWRHTNRRVSNGSGRRATVNSYRRIRRTGGHYRPDAFLA